MLSSLLFTLSVPIFAADNQPYFVPQLHMRFLLSNTYSMEDQPPSDDGTNQCAEFSNEDAQSLRVCRWQDNVSEATWRDARDNIIADAGLIGDQRSPRFIQLNGTTGYVGDFQYHGDSDTAITAYLYVGQAGDDLVMILMTQNDNTPSASSSGDFEMFLSSVDFFAT